MIEEGGVATDAGGVKKAHAADLFEGDAAFSIVLN